MDTREEVNLRNVMAVKQHSEETRKLIRALENRVKLLEHKIEGMDLLSEQIRNLQVKFFSGGATS